MRYVSTRGRAPVLEFDDVLLAGLASDGGLYVPESIPRLETTPDPDWPYHRVAAHVMRPFVGDGVVGKSLDELCRAAYEGFSHPDVAPLTRIDEHVSILELFWGPTLSFKDYALQLVGRMFDAVLTARDQRVLVLGATSGDTGSAAIAGCEGRDRIDIVILYPEGRVSDIQRRQMTTVSASNVLAVSVDGTFDDCQDLVKAAFSDAHLREDLHLAAVNSINWARVMAQTAYYWWAAGRIDESFSVTVPTGNFGNILAASVAQQMGAPIDRLIIGNNANHGLATFVETGRLPLEPVSATLAPAMDIAVSSNLERYLFELLDRSPEATEAAILRFRSDGHLVVSELAHGELARRFEADWIDDAGIDRAIADVYAKHGLLIDPHTAVGWAVSERHRRDGEHMVVVSTAHPAKFEDAVRGSTGVSPDLPERARGLLEGEERIARIGSDLGELRSLLLNRVIRE